MSCELYVRSLSFLFYWGDFAIVSILDTRFHVAQSGLELSRVAKETLNS